MDTAAEIHTAAIPIQYVLYFLLIVSSASSENGMIKMHGIPTHMQSIKDRTAMTAAAVISGAILFLFIRIRGRERR